MSHAAAALAAVLQRVYLRSLDDLSDNKHVQYLDKKDKEDKKDKKTGSSFCEVALLYDPMIRSVIRSVTDSLSDTQQLTWKSENGISRALGTWLCCGLENNASGRC